MLCRSRRSKMAASQQPLIKTFGCQVVKNPIYFFFQLIINKDWWVWFLINSDFNFYFKSILTSQMSNKSLFNGFKSLLNKFALNVCSYNNWIGHWRDPLMNWRTVHYKHHARINTTAWQPKNTEIINTTLNSGTVYVFAVLPQCGFWPLVELKHCTASVSPLESSCLHSLIHVVWSVLLLSSFWFQEGTFCETLLLFLV